MKIVLFSCMIMFLGCIFVCGQTKDTKSLEDEIANLELKNIHLKYEIMKLAQENYTIKQDIEIKNNEITSLKQTIAELSQTTPISKDELARQIASVQSNLQAHFQTELNQQIGSLQSYLKNELNNTKDKAEDKLEKAKNELAIVNSQANTLHTSLKKTIENTELLLNQLHTDMAREDITIITNIPAGIEEANQKYAELKQMVGEQPFVWEELNNNNNNPETLLKNIDTNIEKLLYFINLNKEYFVNNPYKKTLAYLSAFWYFQFNHISGKDIGFDNLDWHILLAKLQTSSAKILILNIQRELKAIPTNPQPNLQLPPSENPKPGENPTLQPNPTNPPSESPKPQVAKPVEDTLRIDVYQKVWEQQIMADRKQYYLALRLYQDLLQLKCLILTKK